MKNLSRIINSFPVFYIVVLSLIVYLSTLSRNYVGDGIQFAMIVESGNLTELLKPNHMLYPLMGLGFYRAWQFFGWQEGALLPLQVLSAIAGALSVGLVYELGRKITKSTKIALLIALGVGVSHGMWLYSTDAESVTIPLVFSLLILYVLISNPDISSWKHPVILGFLCSLSIVTYQTNVFLSLTVIIGYMLTAEAYWRIRLKQTVMFLLITGVFTVVPYLVVAYYVFGINDWQGLLDWQFQLSSLGPWGKPSLSNLFQGGYAFLRAFAGYPGLGPGTRTTQFIAESTRNAKIIFGMYYAAILVLISILPFILLKMFRYRLRSLRRELVILMILGLSFGVFAFYWTPGDIQFWGIVLIVWWLAIGALMSMIQNSANDAHSFGIRFNKIITSLVVALLFCNFTNTIHPNLDATSNRPYQIAISIQKSTSPDDLIITTGGDQLFLTIPYFAKRQTVSLYHRALFSNRDKDKVFAELDQIISQVHSSGGRVFLAGAQPGNDVWWDYLQDVGLTRMDFEHFKTRLAWQVYGEDILEVVP